MKEIFELKIILNKKYKHSFSMLVFCNVNWSKRW